MAFSARYLEKYKGKKVLSLIFAMFADLSQWWEKNLKDFKYGIWVQMRQSLTSVTMQVFNILEAKDFIFMGDDKIMHDGKVFLVQIKDIEEVNKYWESLLSIIPEKSPEK